MVLKCELCPEMENVRKNINTYYKNYVQLHKYVLHNFQIKYDMNFYLGQYSKHRYHTEPCLLVHQATSEISDMDSRMS